MKRFLLFLLLISSEAQAVAPWDECLSGEFDSGQGYCFIDADSNGVPDTYAPLVGICTAGLYPTEIRYLDDNKTYGYCAESVLAIEMIDSAEWLAFLIKLGLFSLLFYGLIRALT